MYDIMGEMGNSFNFKTLFYNESMKEGGVPDMPWNTIIAVVAVLVFLLVGFLLGVLYRKKVSEREISSAEEEAKRIINEGI